ncbi:MAG: hypothetical protein ACYCPN_04245 [Thermoplasmata archaeon]
MEFLNLIDADRATLRWIRTGDRPFTSELRSERGILATLRWAKDEGSLAHAEGANFHWTLKRTGFLDPRVSVRVEGAPDPIARLRAQGLHHLIRTRQGAYRFGRSGLLVPAWEVGGSNGGWALHLEPGRTGRKLEGAILETGSSRVEPDELVLLATLAWYFVVLAWFEDEAIGEWTDHFEGKA